MVLLQLAGGWNERETGTMLVELLLLLTKEVDRALLRTSTANAK
jgi:hypothetical protein